MPLSRIPAAALSTGDRLGVIDHACLFGTAMAFADNSAVARHQGVRSVVVPGHAALPGGTRGLAAVEAEAIVVVGGHVHGLVRPARIVLGGFQAPFLLP